MKRVKSQSTISRQAGRADNLGDGARYSGRGYSRDGGYSRADAKEQMMEQMEELLGSASTERERKAIQRCMEQLEQE